MTQKENPYASPDPGDPKKVIMEVQRYETEHFRADGCSVSIQMRLVAADGKVVREGISGVISEDIEVGKRFPAVTFGEKTVVIRGGSSYIGQYGVGTSSLRDPEREGNDADADSPVVKIEVMGDESLRVTLQNGKCVEVQPKTPLPFLHRRMLTEISARLSHFVDTVFQKIDDMLQG